MKLATKNIVFQGLNEGETVVFSDVETVEQLKHTLVNNYVVLCRNCASAKFCKFHDPSEPPCPILEKVVHNYVDMNIKAVNTESEFDLSEFIKSVILIIQIFNYLENWKGIYVDEWFNWYFQYMHPKLNLHFGHELLQKISQYVSTYRVVQTDRLKRFIVLVEGDSESVALPPIFKALGVTDIGKGPSDSVHFVNLEGKDSVQRDKIQTILTRYKENEVSYFLILDNNIETRRYIEELKREGLIEDDHYLIWENNFEDNFGEEAILKVLREEDNIFEKINLDELKACNLTKHDIKKSVDYLLRTKGIDVSFDNYKVGIAKRLSDWVCQEIDGSMRTSSGVYDGRRTPKSTSFFDLVEKIKKITEEIKKINAQFHIVEEFE